VIVTFREEAFSLIPGEEARAPGHS